MSTVDTKVYTLAEVDMQLEFFTRILSYAKFSDKAKYFDEIDIWLDRRLEVVGKYSD